MPRLLRLLGALAVAFLAIVSAPQAHAATTICVALVVDNADLGGGVHTSCAKVPQGATGYDVLRAGGHTFTVCSNGVLGTIDGKPADGCHVKDNTHYWSYWHRSPGGSSWTYSDEGAGTYEPRNTSTEGWVWQNGSSRQPTNVPYSSICKPAPTPKPTPRATNTAAPRPRGTAPVTQQLPPTSSASTSTKPRRVVTSTSGTPTTAATTTSSRATSTPSSTSVAEPTPHSSSGPSPALLAGVGVAAAIGAAAAVRQWRSR